MSASRGWRASATRACRCSFAIAIDPVVKHRCMALASHSRRSRFAAFAMLFPPTTPSRCISIRSRPIANCSQPSSAGWRRTRLRATIGTRAASKFPSTTAALRDPDLSAVAEFAKMLGGGRRADAHAVLDTACTCSGFCLDLRYMGSVDRRIAMPRLDTPRMHVAAGSVGIAGEQTGSTRAIRRGDGASSAGRSSKVFDPTARRTVSFEGRRLRDVRRRVTMAALSILRPGHVHHRAGRGRWGFQSRGVPVSGAMDWYSHRLANQLLGNDRRSGDTGSDA